MTHTSTTPVEQFFAAFGQGDLEGILRTLHDDVVIIAAGPDRVPWYGSYHGKEGAQAFLTALGSNVETQQFTIHTLIGAGDTVAVAGFLEHRIRSTGGIFASEWALICRIQDQRIVRYQFFEDTAAAATAFDSH